MPHFHIRPVHFHVPELHFHLIELHFHVPEPHFHLTEPHFHVPEPHFHLTELHFRVPEPHFHLTEVHFHVSEPHFHLTERISTCVRFISATFKGISIFFKVDFASILVNSWFRGSISQVLVYVETGLVIETQFKFLKNAFE
ncbi:MAG TPA: hypothetical protein VHB70_17170 [Parafilimonas sp.]|nr:hypothetical protein [Parafilimonas sp.]